MSKRDTESMCQKMWKHYNWFILQQNPLADTKNILSFKIDIDVKSLYLRPGYGYR